MAKRSYSVPKPPTATKVQLRSARGTPLATRVWPPKHGKTRAICLLVHGGGWHSGYFGELAHHLAERGIFCASYDQPCCGYSGREPGTPKKCDMHFNSFDCLIDDVLEAMQWSHDEAEEKQGSIPFYLFGESFGGVQVLASSYEFKGRGLRLDGVIVSGCLVRICPELLPPKPVIAAMSFVAKYYPRLPMPGTDFDSTFDGAFGEKEWAKVARQDSRITISIRGTIAAVAGTVATGEQVLQKAEKFPVPLIAIHGKGDVRTSFEAVQELIDRVGPKKATFYPIETDGHQLLQDTEEITKDVINKISGWIDLQLSSKN